jgi:hypothetical protein
VSPKVVSIKQSIFIGHANPEDNEFTRWLGAKLTLAGYTVWYDSTIRPAFFKPNVAGSIPFA